MATSSPLPVDSPQTFRHPLRNRLVFSAIGPFGLTMAWFLDSSGKDGLWGIVTVFAIVAGIGPFFAWFYSGEIDVAPQSIRRVRFLGSTEIPWAHVSAVEDFGIALKIQTAGASIQVSGELEGWPEFCDLVSRYAPPEKAASLPLTVRRGWGFLLSIASVVLILWLIVAPIFIRSGFWMFVSALSIGVLWCVFALYWRSTGWVFDPESVRWLHPLEPDEWPSSHLLRVSVVRDRHIVRYRFARQAVPVSALRLEFRDRIPIVIPAQYIDLPIGTVQKALMHNYRLE